MSQNNPPKQSAVKTVIGNNVPPIYADNLVKFKISPFTTMLIFGNETDTPNEFKEVATIAIPTTRMLDAMMTIIKTISKDEVKVGFSDSLNKFIKQINELKVQ